ncbi:MAG: FkbM family methyltransferase [Gemmatimonadaceae bacterium]|nr:FkbM family methyltransferase [Gemmatimonadaceae bacterium]
MRQEISINLASAAGPRQLRLVLDPDQMSQRFMLNDLTAGQLYESETSNFIGSILQPGDTFIDIGAHVGYFTMLASTLVGPAGAVYWFEPELSNYAHLLEHIEINAATNVRPLHMAVGASPGTADFFVNADNDGGHALWEVGRHPFNERTRQAPVARKVFVTSLDHIFEQRDMRTLKAIKIDAEGAEFAILVGARELLRRTRIPFIVAEINRFGLESMGASERHVREFMTELGYETYLFQPGQSFIQRLQPDESPETNYVFNVLFRHPEAPALAAA